IRAAGRVVVVGAHPPGADAGDVARVVRLRDPVQFADGGAGYRPRNLVVAVALHLPPAVIDEHRLGTVGRRQVEKTARALDELVVGHRLRGGEVPQVVVVRLLHRDAPVAPRAVIDADVAPRD